jgi:hypothetical protein
MNLIDRINALAELGKYLDRLSNETLQEISGKAQQENAWFTERNVHQALIGISYMLEASKIQEWTARYALTNEVPKIIGLVLAGNIPLVGFHDVLCVLLSGNVAAIKTSSSDDFLVKQTLHWLTTIEPRFRKSIQFVDRLNHIDAVIATGSDNTARYFEYYFKKYPNIIRKNRTSVAILNGSESEEEKRLLADDLFLYFGLGCRNVSKIYTYESLPVESLFPYFQPYDHLINHHKYSNNYDYYKSIYLVNKTPHLDSGFFLLTSSDEIVSPVSVIYHQSFADESQLHHHLKKNQEKIQCIVGQKEIPFGKAQKPEPWDYADNVDVMAFLSSLR